jgi:hypothetical protein
VEAKAAKSMRAKAFFKEDLRRKRNECFAGVMGRDTKENFSMILAMPHMARKHAREIVKR